MQNNKFHYSLHILPILFFMAFVSASCIKDDLGDCPAPRTPGFSLLLKAFDADGGSLDSETIKDITLYIFDANKALLDIRNVLLSETVTLDYPGHDNLKLVAWGNGKQGALLMPALKEGDHLETAFVSLIQTRTTLPVAGSPNDLFYGTIDITPAADASVRELPLRRKVSGVTITARHLREYIGSTEGEYHYIVRKTTDKLDFYGRSNGTEVSYRPQAAFNDKGEFVSPAFNIFPTEADIKIDIYHRDVLKTTVITDSNGNPLRVSEGRLLNVLVDFQGAVSVDVRVTDWGKQAIWKEF